MYTRVFEVLYSFCSVGPFTCDVSVSGVDTGGVLECDGLVPPDVEDIECLLDDLIFFNCKTTLISALLHSIIIIYVDIAWHTV